MPRRSPLVTALLIIALIIALGFYFYEQQNLPTDDQTEATVTRATPKALPGTAIPDIGSGGSTMGSWYELRFTAPQYPDNPANHHDGLDAMLVRFMDSATRTLDVADYDFDLAPVADAMVRAKGRGVAVRMVTDSDTTANTKDMAIQAAFAKVKGAGIPVVEDMRGPIMHHKFTVVDNAAVETGSWNYTDGDTYHLNNNAMIIREPRVAANYTAEFARMFERRTFGPSKERGIPNPIVTEADGSRVETCFAPQNDCAGRIIATVQGAQTSVRFLAFSFTHDPIGQAIIARSQAGVQVGGVFETTGSNVPSSEYGKMKAAGLPVYTDGNPWTMHHKVIIIDERIVIFGSFNFSDNAAKANDENLLIVENADIARAFTAEYDRILALAKNPPPKQR